MPEVPATVVVVIAMAHPSASDPVYSSSLNLSKSQDHLSYSSGLLLGDFDPSDFGNDSLMWHGPSPRSYGTTLKGHSGT